MLAKATDLCGQPPALAELPMGSNLQKGYVSTQVKVFQGNVTNSFLISQEEEEGAPPSKQEKGKEGKEKEKKQCVHTVEPPTVAGRAKGEGCKRDEAIQDGRDKVADDKCKGEFDPKCEGDCPSGTCQVTAKGSLIGAPPCVKIVKEGCPKNEAWSCTVESRSFDCRCRCR
jgi:hypothetical protein